MSQTGLVEDDEHSQTNEGLWSLTGRAWIDDLGVEGLYGVSVMVRSTAAAVNVGKSKNRLRVGCAKSGGSISIASQRT